jgi:drug/metabolite transporter (DMT)-like permease
MMEFVAVWNRDPWMQGWAMGSQLAAVPRPPSVPAAAQAGAGGLMWGAVGVAAFSVSLPMTRLAVAGGLPGGFVGIGRAVVAGLLAALTLVLMRQRLPPARLLPRFAIVVVGVVVGFPWLTALALVRVPAAHGIVVTGLLPAATAVAAVLRSGERPSRRFWLAAAAGVLCVLAFAVAQGAGEVKAADALLLAAVALCGLGYAEGGALSRSFGGVQVICLALVLALPLTATIMLLQWDGAALARATPAAWGGFAYAAVVSSFAGFFAWYRGLARGGVARIGQLQLAQPVLSLLWAWLLLGEVVTPAMMLTALGVLACVVATQRAR